MLETLKTLQDSALLVPISTVITGSFAIIAVLINNWFMSRNLTRQIQAQAYENEKKLSSETQIATLREKRVKLESLFDHLHLYLEEIELCFQITKRADPQDEFRAKELSDLVLDLRERYDRSNKHLSKAQILASAYSDVVKDEFDLIKEYGKPARQLFELLFIFEARQHAESISDPEQLRFERRVSSGQLLQGYVNANSSENKIKETITALEKRIIGEIRSLVEQERSS